MKKIFFLVMLCLFNSLNLLQAQWMKAIGTDGGFIKCFVESNTKLFAGTYNKGVLLSTNNGASWTAVNNGLTNTNVSALATSGTNLLAGTQGNGVFLSTNNGSNWSLVDSGLTYPYILTLAVSGSNIFAGASANLSTGFIGGVFLSTNNGTSWTAVDSGLMCSFVYALAISGNNLFAGTDAGIFHSINNGKSWTAVGNGFGAYTFAFAISDTNLIAGTASCGLIISNTNGANWTHDNLPIFPPTNSVYSLAILGTNLFAGTGAVGISKPTDSSAVFVSTNNGKSWHAVVAGMPSSAQVYALAISGANLFAGTFYDGVWRRPLSEMITSVERLSSDLPMQFSLDQNYPNPFNPTTTISFNFSLKSFASLKVFDALGKEVSILFEGELPAGKYAQQWNGAGLPSGVYFCRLQAGSFTETKRLLLLR